MQNAKSINNLLPSVQCGLCDETFSENKTASLHLLANHNTTKQFLLEIKHYNEIVQKSVSEPTSNKEIHRCISCDKTFNEEEQFQSHIKSFHKEIKLSCNVCLETFPSKENLKSHIMDIHIQKKLSFDNSKEDNDPPEEVIEIQNEKGSNDAESSGIGSNSRGAGLRPAPRSLYKVLAGSGTRCNKVWYKM